MAADLVQSSGGGVQPYGNGASVASWQQPGAAAAPSDSSMLGNALHRTVAALKRYLWLIILTTAFGSAVGFFLSKRITPKYVVNASVWIREQSAGGPIQPPGLVSTNLGWADLVMSQAVLDSVVVRLALFAIPEQVGDTVLLRSMQPTDTLIPGSYVLSVAGPKYLLNRVQGPRGETVTNTIVEQGSVGDSVGRAIGVAWFPDWTRIPRERAVRFDLTVPREASGRIVRQLQVMLQEQSNFMRLNLSGTEPVLLASTMNTILDVFLETARRLKRTDLTETYESLEAQRQQAAADMASTARALENYRIRTITLPSDNVPVAPGITIAQNPVFGSYFADRTQLSSIKQDRELLQEVLNERRQGGTGWIEKLRLIASVQASNPNLTVAITELDNLRNRLRLEQQTRTDSHSVVIKLRRDIRSLESQDIPQLAQVSLNQLNSRERDLSARVRSAGKELESIPSRSIEEDRLNRNYQVAVSVYNELHNRTINAKLAESSVQPDVSVLERAVPPGRPSTDTAYAIFLIAIASSLGAGLFLAIMLDRLDKRFRYPEQAVGELGLDILGAIPSFKNPKNSAARLEEWSQLMEAFRSLGLSVRSAFPPNEPISFTISSPGPGDGKSFISLNLSMVMAEAGFRTVLVDGDIRRGRLHETKPLIDCSQSPGLVEHLAGEATLAEVVRETTHANLCVIPCGARRRQGPELLASETMQRLVAELRSQFDAVIIDSAPLAAGIDPYALGAASGAMIIVLRAGETNTKLAQAKLGTIDRLPVRLIGSVLNDVGKDATYRYYSYLGYEYAPADDAEGNLVTAGAKD